MAVDPVPPEFEGFLIPYLVVDDAAAAIAFYCDALGAREESRAALGDGTIINAQLRIDSQPVWVMEDTGQAGAGGRSPTALGDTPVALHRFVTDVDAAVDRAVAGGATVKMPPTDMFWGDRYAAVADPFGHEWTFAARQENLSQRELDDRLR